MSWSHMKEKDEQWLQFVQSLAPNIDPGAVRLLDELRQVSRAIIHLGEQSLDGTGRSMAQYRVLMHLFFAEKLGGGGELNPSQISDRQGVGRNTISALLRNLEEEGLIERRLDPLDRRRFNISLTAAGRALVTEHARRHLYSVATCFEVLDAGEQELLSRLLHKIGQHVQEMRPPVREKD